MINFNIIEEGCGLQDGLCAIHPSSSASSFHLQLFFLFKLLFETKQRSFFEHMLVLSFKPSS